jgi:anti-sigma B factor antagonist
MPVDVAIVEDAPRGCTVVKLRGELDIASVPELRDQLIVVLDRRTPGLMVIDLSDLEFIDSSGTAVLVNTQRRARLLGCTLALVAPQPAVSRVLQICGLDRFFLIFEDFSAAAGLAPADPPSSPTVSGHDTSSA